MSDLHADKRPETVPSAAATAAADHSDMREYITQNIAAIGSLHDKAQSGVSVHQHMMERLIVRLGKPSSIYSVCALVAVWIAANGATRWLGVAPLDPPPFQWLQGVFSLCAFLVSLMILTRQNRQGHLAHQRSHLELQVGLLTEQKIAKLIGLVEELRRDLPNVRNRHDPVAEAMTHTADPEVVMTELEQSTLSKVDHNLADGSP